MGGSAEVLGTVVTLESDSACITFAAVIILLLALEHGIHIIEHQAKHNGYHGVFNKVNKEMMILGLVSFATFVVFEGASVSNDSVWYHAFHFSHFVMLFIALAFVFQALLLTKFISIQRQRLYRLFYVAENKIVSKYEYMMNYAKNTVQPKFLWLMYTLFFEAPYSFPYPALRDAMEYKIIEEHFVRTFLLPEQFHFAEYMSTRFQSHVFGLVDVQPSSWFVLILIILANYGRIKVIDPLVQEDVCYEFEDHHHDDHHDDGGHRRLFVSRMLAAAAASPACDQYTLRVAFVYSMFLSLFIFMVYLVSNFYYRRHLQHAVRAVAEPVQYRCEQHVPFRPELDDDADFKRTGHRYRSFYKTCLLNIASIKNHERSINTVRVLKKLRDLELTVALEQEEAARAVAEEKRATSTRDGETIGGRTSSSTGSTNPGRATKAPESASVIMSVSEAERAADSAKIQDSSSAAPEPQADVAAAPLLHLDSDAIREPRDLSWAPPPTDGGRHIHRNASLVRVQSFTQPPSRSRPRSVSKLDSTFANVQRLPSQPQTPSGDAKTGDIRPAMKTRGSSFTFGGDDDDGIQMSRAGNVSLGGRGRSLTTQLQGDFHELERFDNSVSRGQSLQDFYAHVSTHLNKAKHHDKGHSTPPPGSRRRKTELVTVAPNADDSTSASHVVLSELKLENDTSHIFLWRSQWVYRFSVEVSLLLQCFYMALWATNLIVVATGAEHFPVEWAIGLTFPMVVNFWMLRSILFLSCTLEAVSMLDVTDSGLVCERIMQKEDALDKFRCDVRRKLLEKVDLHASDRRKFIREQLRELDYVNENDEEDTSQDTTEYRITYEQFGVFLDELDIEKTDAEFDLLCHVLDDQKTNISGDKGALNIMRKTGLMFENSISILHIYSVLFPEVHFLLESHNMHLPTAQMAEESLDLYDSSTVNERQLFRRDESQRNRAQLKTQTAAAAGNAPKFAEAPWYHFEGLRRRMHNLFEPPKSFADDVEVVDEQQAGNSEYKLTETAEGAQVFNEPVETVVDADTGQIVMKRMHSKANIMGDEMFARKKSERRSSKFGSSKKGQRRPSMKDEIEMVVDGSVFGFYADDDEEGVDGALPVEEGDIEAGSARPRPRLARAGSESAGDYEYSLSIDSHAKNVGISKISSRSAAPRENSMRHGGKS